MERRFDVNSEFDNSPFIIRLVLVLVEPSDERTRKQHILNEMAYNQKCIMCLL